MEWQQILGFCQVARLRSFSRAAEATFRTQSALSQQIKALEEELHCVLFERPGKRVVRLTPEGEEFLRFAEAVLDRRRSLLTALAELKGIPKGPLRMAAAFTTLYHLFPRILRQYAERYPQVSLTILDRPQSTVLDLVRKGDIDFGFVLESLIPKDMVGYRWKPVETVLLTPIGHPLTSVKDVTWHEIAEYPLILPPRNASKTGRMSAEEHLRRGGISYRVVMESSNVELSSVYVEQGLGVAFATIVRDDYMLKGRKLAFTSLAHFFEPDHIAIVSRKAQTRPAYQDAFLSLLLEEQG